MSLKDFQMEPLDEIEREINYDFDFEETCDPKNPIRGRIIIGNANNKPLIDLHTHDWKIVVLEIGLEYLGNDEDYEWYWEITCRDIKETKCIIKKHNTGFTASYVPGGQGCSGVPTDWATYGAEVDEFSEFILQDIKENFFPVK